MRPLSSVQTMSLERLPCASHHAAASSVSSGSESMVAKVWFTAQLYRPTIGRRSSCVAGRISNGLVAFAEGFVFAITRPSLHVNSLGCHLHDDPGLCLLYTSDAADDLLCVDLGGRRI